MKRYKNDLRDQSALIYKMNARKRIPHLATGGFVKPKTEDILIKWSENFKWPNTSDQFSVLYDQFNVASNNIPINNIQNNTPKGIFIAKWSNFWLFDKNKEQITKAFGDELDQIIEIAVNKIRNQEEKIDLTKADLISEKITETYKQGGI